MTPQTPAVEPMSEPARIGGVFFEPGKAFADIVARPRNWWVPIVLVVIAACIFMFLFSQRVGWEHVVRQSVESNSQAQNLPPAQREQQIAMGTKVAGIIGYVGAAVGTPVVALIIAGILMFGLNAMAGAQATFKQSLAIVSYSFLTGLVSMALSIVVLYLKNPEDFDIQNPLAFNLGAFLGADTAKWLKALAQSIDLFTFWTIALMAIGYAATAKKLKFGKAFTSILVLWGVWVVLKVGWAAAFSK